MINSQQREIKVPFSWLECTPGLSSSSRFIWLHLHFLLECSTKAFIEGDVKSVSARLCVSDKTFKKAVDELRSEKLLKRRKCKTSLGANSFRYIPIFSEDMVPHDSESQICVNGETLLHPIFPREAKKLTVSQRLLLMVVKSFSAGLGIVTSLNVKRLSKLTGIREINIYSNLAKLAELKCLSKISKTDTSMRRKLKTWIFMPKYQETSTGYLFQITRTQFSEVSRAWELLHEITLTEAQEDRCSESNAFATKTERHYGFIIPWDERPFPSLNPDLLKKLKETLIKNEDGFRTAIKNIGLFYLDFLTCFAATQILSGRCLVAKSSWKTNVKWVNAYFLTMGLLTDFHLPSVAKKQIAEIIQSLSEITALSFKRSTFEDSDIDFTNAKLCLFDSFAISIELDILHSSEINEHTIVTQSNYFSGRTQAATKPH